MALDNRTQPVGVAGPGPQAGRRAGTYPDSEI